MDDAHLVLFSGTDDKLQAAAVLTAAAAALGKPVDLSCSTGRLDAVRADRITRNHGLSPERRRRSCHRRRPARHRPASWAETFRQAKGWVASTSRPARCRWTCSTSSDPDLDPLVDGVEGVTAFYLNAGEGQVVFI